MGIAEKVKQGKKGLSSDAIMKALDSAYKKVADGIPIVSPPIDEFANNYLSKKKNAEEAARSMIHHQIAKCTTSGFLTGFGGIITLPVAIPANVGSVLYVQMRMIACVAYLAGYDISCDQVQTLVYACLAGVSVNEIVKKAGIKIGEKVATNMIKKIPGKTLTKINQKVGFRLITKFGSKGIINLGKMIPAFGAFIGGGFDFAETKAIGDRTYKLFFSGDYSVGTEVTSEEEAKAKKIEADVKIV